MSVYTVLAGHCPWFPQRASRHDMRVLGLAEGTAYLKGTATTPSGSRRVLAEAGLAAIAWLHQARIRMKT